MDKEDLKIEKLKDSESFLLWKFEFNIYVKAAKLSEVIDNSTKQEVKKSEEFITKDAKVQKIIINTIDRKLKGHILGCTNAKEMFQKLCDIFEGSENRNKSALLQEFFNFKQQNRSITEVISEIENIRFRLNQIGENINEEMVISKILTCLPSSLNYFITAWESTPDEKKTLTNLTNRLLSEETRIENKKSIKTESELVFQAVKKGNSNIKCFKCNKTGHIKRDCKMCSICKKFHAEKDCKFKDKQCSICKKTNHKEENCFFKKRNNNNSEAVFLTKTVKEQSKSKEFIVDSGCTAHMTNNMEILTKFENKMSTVLTANDQTIDVQGQGTVESNSCQLNNTLFVPDISQNLLSVNAVTNNNGTVVFNKNEVKIYKESQLIITGEKENGLYKINLNNNNTEGKTLLMKENGTAYEWHQRLGHPGKAILEKLPKMVDGIKIQGIKQIDNCEICTQAKQTRLPFNSVRTRAIRPLQIIHTDVCGPFDKLTYDGYSYFLTVMDDYTHFTKVYLLKHKSEVQYKLRYYITETERERNEKVSTIRCDNGGEYTSNDFRHWCTEKGIKLDLTVPYTPQLNGKAERLNRTLLNKTRALLFDSELGKEMWGEAIYCATYIINRLPSESLENKTPYEKWHGKRPNIANIQKFGSKVYAKLIPTNIKKLDPRSKKLIMIGYTNNGYRLWNTEERKTEISRDIVIINNHKNKEENNRLLERQETTEIISDSDEEISEEIQNNESSGEIQELLSHSNETENNLPVTIEEEIKINETTDDKTEEETESTNTKRKRKIPTYLQDYVLLTYDDAMKSDEKENWEKAIKSEKESLESNNTWEIVDTERANGHKILTNKWIFCIKENGIYKARLVARGFEQKDIDYQEIYSPVVSQSALKTVMAIAASKDYDMMTFDVKTAFLYGELTEDVFMNIPEGYEKQPNKVCHLKKALYGLKQAPITWNKKFTETMLKLGLKPTKTDQCVFTTEDKTIIIAIYVDDGLAITKDKEKLWKILKHLEKEFKIKVYKKPTNYIGFEITRTTEGILLHQKNYTERLLRKYNMFDCKPSGTPSNTDKTAIRYGKDTSHFPYRELVGGLLYLSTRSRPDISQAVNEASKKLENPSRQDIVAIKKILKYLNGTRYKGIMYKKGEDMTNLDAYCDSDYAGCIETRRSTTGFIIMISGGPVSWCSKRQPIVSLSSTEAEYIAAAECLKECLYLKVYLSELIGKQVKISLSIDNQSAIQLIKTGSFSKRSKHIDVRYYFIHENYKKGDLDIRYCPTNLQIADMFTKPLSIDKFQFHCKKIMQ